MNRLIDQKVSDFIGAVASSSPAPGGGSVAALMAALGISLLSMVARLTIGKKKYAQHDELMNELLQKADTLRENLTAQVDRDTEAFNKVSAVFAMPKDTDDEKSARQNAMQEALKSAADVPLEVIEQCLQALELTEAALGKSNTSAASDLGVAALSLLAGAKSAWLNVKINIAGIKDEAYVKNANAKGETLLKQTEEVAERIYLSVEASLA